MRFVLPSVKVAEKNPDRLGTVHGEFFNEKGEPYSFASKIVTKAEALDKDTLIDVENGILILPSGERGRKPSASATQDQINALLESARNSATS